MRERSKVCCHSYTMRQVIALAVLCFLALSVSGFAEPVTLGESEREWIRAHPSLRVANEMDWPPFDFAEDGEPLGYSIDLIRLVAEKVGLNVEFVNGLTWAELMDRFKQGQIDVMPAIYESEERKGFALFTPSYFSQPSVIVVRASEDNIRSLADLDGHEVAAIPGFVISDVLRDKFPAITQVPVDSVIEGMNAVSTGDADAFIDSIGVVSQVARQTYIPNIKFLTRIPLGELASPDLHMAVGKDEAVLCEILTRGIATVTSEEREQLRRKWLHMPDSSDPSGQASPEAVQPPENPIPWWILPVALIIITCLAILSRIIDRPVTEAEMARMSGTRRFWLAVTLSNLKISAKILLILVLVAATSVGLFGYMDYKEARRSLQIESFKKLTAVREMKGQQVEDYFGAISGQVITFSESRTVVDAMRKFKESFAALESEAAADHGSAKPADLELIAYYRDEFLPRLKANTARNLQDGGGLSFVPTAARSRHLQEQYIAENPHPAGEKHKLHDPGDGSDYSAVHMFYHPIVRNFLEKFGYYDIFLVDHETGHIVYSVYKEIDYATSLLTGPYRRTNFADAFRAARNAEAPEFVRLVDFDPYAPSYDAPASFIASPIFDGNEKIGVLIFQMPIDRINGIMTSHQAWQDVGLGESGETYLVGHDSLMRNQSRFLIEDRENYLQMIRNMGLRDEVVRQIETLDTSIGLQPVDTKGTRAALAGKTATEVFVDYRGLPVLSSYRRLTIPGVRWAIMSEIDEAEAMAPAEQLKRRTMMLMVLFLGGILAISFAFAKTMTRPIKVLTAKANALAQGDLGVSIQIGGGDEIAQLGRSFDVMRKALADLIGGLEEKVAERTAKLTRANEELTSVNSVIMRWDTAGNVVYMNPFGLQLFGFAEDEIVGRHVVGTILPATESSGRDLGAMTENILSRPERYESNENEAQCRNGRKVWMAWRNKPVTSEDGMLSEILSVGMDITERKNLEGELAEANKRMGQELSIGHEIQMSMLPLIFPAFPEQDEFDVFATLSPAREVGGDFYDFYFLDEDHFCFCVGDVSGKGVPAALFMAVTKTLIKSRASSDFSPASIITHVNDELSRDNESCMFVTLYLAIVDLRTGEMVVTNAGHNPPLIKRRDTTIEWLRQRHGPVVGAMPGVAYGQDTLQLAPEDVILLYTDGVTEADDGEGGLFGEPKLEEALAGGDDAGAEPLVARLRAAVYDYEGDDQADDITLLGLCYEGRSIKGDTLSMDVTIANDLPEIVKAIDAFEQAAEEWSLPMAASSPLCMVLDELLNNVITYAFPDGEKHEIAVRAERVDDAVVLTIIDDGAPFNPFAGEAPDTTASVEEREIGGLGIHLVRKMTDDASYQRRVGQNVVKITKKVVRNNSETSEETP